MMPFNGDAPDESGAARKPKPLNTCARCGVQIARPKKRCMPCWDIVRSERASVYARAAYVRRKAQRAVESDRPEGGV